MPQGIDGKIDPSVVDVDNFQQLVDDDDNEQELLREFNETARRARNNGLNKRSMVHMIQMTPKGPRQGKGPRGQGQSLRRRGG